MSANGLASSTEAERRIRRGVSMRWEGRAWEGGCGDAVVIGVDVDMVGGSI